MYSIGVRDYLHDNEMVSGLEHEGDGFVIDFERTEKSEDTVHKEDMRLNNKIKHTRIYIKISEELREMRDISTQYRNIDIGKERKIESKNYLDINFDGYKRKRADIPQKLRGNIISGIAKDMKEDEKKQKVRRSIEATLRKMHTKKRMSCKTYKNYLLYVFENFDIMNADELKEELKMIQQEFKPSQLAQTWEANEKKKDNAIHICNRKKD